MKTFQGFPRFQAIAAITALWGTALCAQTPGGNQPSAQKPAESKAAAAPVKGEAQSATTAPQKEAEWKSLFDGKTLKGWAVTDFAGTGKVDIQNGQIMLHSGLILTGVNWTNEIPKTNFEIELEAMKEDGSDFFCCLTFPVNNSHCSFVVGGWGGAVVGISSIDGMDASENDTTKFMNFEKKRWYRVRVRVTPAKIETWIDNEKFADQPIEDRKIGMRPGEIELSIPLGIATYQTTAALKNIRLRSVGGK